MKLSGMNLPLPLQFFFLLLVGWVNRHQDDVFAYLSEENPALKELWPKGPRASLAPYAAGPREGGLWFGERKRLLFSFAFGFRKPKAMQVAQRVV